jgi:hypothetical protein
MGFSTSLDGIGTAMRSLDRAAFDIARASSQRGGLPAPPDPAGTAPPPAPAAVAPVPALPSQASPEVDLPRSMVDMISASNSVMANLQAIRRTDENLKAILALR